MLEPWTPIDKPGNLTVRIADHIRELIQTHQLSVGQRLPSEREMARLLGVSRPALREAVKLLEASGQLQVQHGVGNFIRAQPDDPLRAGLSEQEGTLTELFAMREVLEKAAAAWAAEAATGERIEMLESTLHKEELACQPPLDFERLAQLNASFHLQIVQMAGNRFLSRTVGVLHEMIAAGMETTLSIPGRVEQSMQEHRIILDAIRHRDSERAGQAIAAHIHGAREAALERVRATADQPPQP